MRASPGYARNPTSEGTLRGLVRPVRLLVRTRKTGRQEDGDLGLGSRADQGPWSSAASASTVSPAMADADATELQGNGEALGECARKKRQRQDGDRVFFSFFSSKTKMGWIRAKRVRGQAERMDGDSRPCAEYGSLMQNDGAQETSPSFQKTI